MSGGLGVGRGGRVCAYSRMRVVLERLEVKSVITGLPVVRKNVKIKIDLDELTKTITGRNNMKIVSATRVNFRRPRFRGSRTGTGLVTVGGRVGGTGRLTYKRKVMNIGVVITLGRCGRRILTTIRTNTSIVVDKTKLPVRLPRLISRGSRAEVTPVISSGETTGLVLGV